MQQTKQTRQACAGGAAVRQDAVARQVGSLAGQNGGVTAPGADAAPAIPGLPPGGFATILVDPPWPLQSGEKHYRTMSLARIKALPVGQLAARDAHLVKFRLGLGGRYQLRNATEQLLFCTRGRAPLGSRSQPTWFNAPVTEHSRKPAEQFAIIERVSPGPYLELFARRRPESNQPWAVWGDQVDSDIRIPGFAVPRYSERAHEAEAGTPTKTAERTESVQTAVAGASRGDARDDSAVGNGEEVER